MSLKTFNLTYTENETDILKNSLFEKTGVIIVAAGTSSRMGEKDKILLPLEGIPVIVRTLMAFEEISAVSNIVIVTRNDMVISIENLVSDYNISKVSDIVLGGESRAESAKNGFDAILKIGDIKNVLIHDGARPLVSRKVIEGVISATEEFGAAIPAVPVKDTVKAIGALGKVAETPDRSKLRLVQTPQGFKTEIYKKALEFAGEDISAFTDDSALVENSNIQVYTTLGDYKNIKITTPEDLCLAKAILEFERGKF